MVRPLRRRPVLLNPAPDTEDTPDARPDRSATADDGAFENIVPWYHARVLEAIDAARVTELTDEDLEAMVSSTVQRLEPSPDAPAIGGSRNRLAQRLVDEMRGLGPLGDLLRDPDVSDIMVNGMNTVYVERKGRLAEVGIKFRDSEHLTRIAQRIAQGAGRRVDELSPMCDARLDDGSRVNIIVPPLAIDGAAISIRRFKKGGFTVAELARNGAMHPNMAALLEVASKSRLNIVVSGGTGSGKTTLLNALSGFIPYDERVVTLEDAAELSLMQPHVVRLETRPPSVEGTGEVPMRDLLKNALRMRPDRVVVGEVRGPEAMDALQAMNTGHPGSMFTIHANSPRDTVARLEYLVMMESGEMPLGAIRNQVISAVDLIVQVDRFRDGVRRVVAITDVAGLEGDVPVLEDLWAYDAGDGVFRCSGNRPSFADRVAALGHGDALNHALGRGGR